MSTYEAFRNESAVEFIDTARKLVIHTRRNCVKMPKRYTFFGVQHISALADEVYTLVKQGNSIRPSGSPERLAHEAQMRRDYFTKALATLQALAGHLGMMTEILKGNPECEKWIYKADEEWARLINKEIELLKGVREAEAKRYKGTTM